MQVELAALEKIGKWKLDDLPCNVKSIGCIWVCKIKHHVDGSIEWFKARLISRGYNQIQGMGYFATCSFVAKLTTV